MNILLLSAYPEPLLAFLQADNRVVTGDGPVSQDWLAEGFDFVVSYGYPYLFDKTFVGAYERRIINLHISLLPWNRGADPNFWSFFDDTPTGVSVHWIDEGIDTGDVIAQRSACFQTYDTLCTSYSHLRREVESLFLESWHEIVAGNLPGRRQDHRGTYHTRGEIDQYFSAPKRLEHTNLTGCATG